MDLSLPKPQFSLSLCFYRVTTFIVLPLVCIYAAYMTPLAVKELRRQAIDWAYNQPEMDEHISKMQLQDLNTGEALGNLPLALPKGKK